MNDPHDTVGLARRDWLKTAGLGGAAGMLASYPAVAETSAAPAKKVRGVVFMVSDGMSPGVLTLAEAYSKLTRKRGTRWWQLINEPSSSRASISIPPRTASRKNSRRTIRFSKSLKLN